MDSEEIPAYSIDCCPKQTETTIIDEIRLTMAWRMSLPQSRMPASVEFSIKLVVCLSEIRLKPGVVSTDGREEIRLSTLRPSTDTGTSSED